MAKKKSPPGSQPILSYSHSSREVELPADVLKLFENYAAYYNQFSGMEITAKDVISSKSMELFKDPKSLTIEPYEPPVKKTLDLPDGAWAGLDRAAKEQNASDRDAIIAIARKLSREEAFANWSQRKKSPAKKRQGASAKTPLPVRKQEPESLSQ